MKYTNPVVKGFYPDPSVCFANGFEAFLRLNIGGIKHIRNVFPLGSGSARLIIRSDSLSYTFIVSSKDASGTEHVLGSGQSKYLSSEVCRGFTGTVLGLYCVNGSAEFEKLNIMYNY